MKKTLFFLSLLFSLCWSFAVSGQVIPGDSIVYGPMMSPVYENSVRVWVLTKNNTGSGDNLSISFAGANTPETLLTGMVYNQDDRLGYSLRSYEYTNLQPGTTYTAKVMKNGVATTRTSTIKNETDTIDDFEFLSGGCGRIYDLSRCIDQPESEFHINGDPEMFNVMANEGSDMMIWLGDATYLLGLQHAMGQCPDGVDDWANKDMAFDRYMFYRDFHDNLTKAMPQLAITDNHDIGPNEFDKNMPTIAEMREIFMDWWPNPEYKSTPEGQGLFSSYKYKDVEYFLLDNRSYRDNTVKHLGPDQMAWFKTALLNSTATFKVIINGTPSFERNCGGRNFCTTEQSVELINYIKDNNINGVMSLSADIHEQKFMIRDGDVKYPLYDILSGNLNSDIGSGNHYVNYESNYLMTGVKQTYLRINVYGDADDRRMKVEYVGPTGLPYFETIIHEDMLTSQDADAHKLALHINNTIEDASQYNHNVQAANFTFDADRDNNANGALKFSETTSINIANSNALDFHDRPFSITFWVNPETIPTNGAAIISNATANTGLTFGIDNEGKLMFTDHALQVTHKSQYKLLADTWSYITWKYDNVKRNLSLYYNGLLIQNWSNVVPPVASSADILIGNNFQNKKFIGLLDEVSIYGRLISDQSILEEADIENNRGEVLKVSGAQQMLVPGNLVNTALSEDFTIEFWGKLTANPGTNFKLLASNGRINGNSTGISFEFPDSKKLNVVVGTNASGWNTLSEQGESWNIGEWNHVVLSAVKNGTMKYYVNGQLIAQGPFAEYIPNTFGLGLGYSPFYGSAVQAELDELRIWDRALTQEEVVKNLHYPLEGNEEDLAIYYDFSPYNEGASIISEGTTVHEIQLNGGLLAPATAPVGNITADYQDVVTGKWSKNNNATNSGLNLTDAITGYTSNVIIGKNNDTDLAAVPGNEGMFYLKGGWKIDPLNNPFATVKINLEQSLVQNDSIVNIAGEYFLLKQNEANEFVSVADGSFDGNNVTFYNTNLEDTVYYLAWSEGDFPAGRGGALSLAGGHEVNIPYADVNPIFTGGFTVEFWVNLLQDPANNDKLISNHGKINGNSTGFAIEIPNNNSVTAAFGTNTANWNSINSGSTLTVGEWNHIAVTAAPNDMIKLYINGELKASNPYTSFVTNNLWNFALGKSINYGGQTMSVMDEFHIWNEVRTQEEIQSQMHAIIANADENLIYNLTFNQEDNGTLINTGAAATGVAYLNAQIIDATSPVSEVNAAFPDQISGNWSIANANTNGLYVKNDISSFTENVVIGHNTADEVLPLASVADTFYVTGGWHLNALNIESTTLQVDLEKVFEDADAVNATVSQYFMLLGDPAGDYQVVGTAQAVDNKVDFENLTLTAGNYYLAYETDLNAAIGEQGGAINLAGNHEVLIPKEGVNAALSGPFTIEMWARLTQTAGANTKLVGFTSFSGGNFGWEMEFLGNQTLQTITGQGPSGGWNSLNSSYVWQLNEWNHTAVTFTPNGEFKFYINGELVDNMAVTQFYPNVNSLALGKNVANGAPTNSTIDEFRIWTKAKTIEEIREQMHTTITEPTENLVYNYTFNHEDSGYLVNSGSQNVEVAYTNATIIPATSPVRDMEANYSNNVSGNWSVKNDNKNGLYLQDEITSLNNNLVIGKGADGEVLPIEIADQTDTFYLNSGWLLDPLFIENGSPKVDLTKVFDNLNDVNLLANNYFLLKGDTPETFEVIATGTKTGNIVSFSEIALDSEVVYLAWKNEATTFPIGTFPIAPLSLWKYNDSGMDLGTDWKNNAFDDATWAFGNGILGYGDNAESTTLDFGTDAQDKHITYYLRHTFEVENADEIGNLVFKLLKDDGVVVYVNGTEAFRSNMPEGTISYTTLASTAIGGGDETTYQQFQTANLLQNGTNVIAVELHQAAANSSDLGFDMEVDFELPEIPASPYPMVKNSEWYYLDNGTSQDATTWNEPTAENENWSRGFGPLGYGDPMNTVISYGPDASNKYITSYFYRDIEINTAEIADLVEFGLRRDDGAVLYINGVEAFRDNMPEGEITYLTNSANTIDGANENKYFSHVLPSTVFQNGINRIAVEIHNRNGQSSDLGFDLYIKDKPGDELEVDCNDPHIGCFTSIVPTGQTNKLIIPVEHRFQLLFKQGESYTVGSGTVPGNHDYTAYVPANGSSETGHLSVNHENTPGGVSMIDLHLDTDQLLWVKDASQAIDFYNDDLVTTTRNCSGGVTPWGTVITAEENTAAADVNGDGYQDEGWLVEIDPVTKLVKEYGNGIQEKLWALGRMNHENIVVANDNVTAYYGEDGGTHCVYKFVADTPGNLSSGTVYVLKLDLPLSNDEPSSATAQWIEVPNTTAQDRNNLNTVAGALGGTNFNGVEDCEISPLDGKIYFTTKGKNRVFRFKDDGASVSEFETFVGGTSYPVETANGIITENWGDGNDNLTFDDKGNLWVLQDGGNNYIWVIRPDHTQNDPNVLLFASMPAGSEPTGMTFTPDFKYGFFSVQHPNGNNAAQLDATFGNVTFDASAAVVFALKENLGLQAPLADFIADEVVVNEGETVTFTDLSTNNPTSWLWTFEGGTPATSTVQSPTVVYETAGTYDVSLVTSNLAGNSPEVAKADYILVEEELGIDTPNPLADKVSIYPNPTNGIVNIQLNDEAGKKVVIDVYDILGRRLSHLSDIETTGASQKIVLNVTDLVADQMLIIQIQVDGETGTYKLLKKN